MESLPQETQSSLSDEGLLEDVLGTLARDFIAFADTDIGGLFIGFYAFMALCCCGMFFYCMREKGLLRHFAFSCILLCVFFSGYVASLAILDLKQPVTIIEKTRARESSPRTLITGSRPESLGYKPAPEVREIVIPPQLDYREISRRRERGYDAEGNLLEDDLSHEDSYPQYSE